MANLLGGFVLEPPSKIRVAVDFYDETHRKLLCDSPAWPRLWEQDLPSVIEIPTADLLTYYLFYKKRPGALGYSDFNEIVSKYHNAIYELDGLVLFQNDSLCVTSLDLSRGTTERLGEAFGLSVVSKIHGLIDADWSKINENNKRRTLDYECAASDGDIIIKIENKGSISEDNTRKTSSVSNHKKSIEEKKYSERKLFDKSKGILYGTIAVFDNREASVAKCWLLDPAVDVSSSPRRFRILARLNVIVDLISFIGSRSQLSAALQTRLTALNALDNIDYLDGVSLRKGDGGEFSTETYDMTGYRNPWFAAKSLVIDGPAGGQVFQLDQKNLVFIGIREDLIVYSIEQKFDVISSFSFESGVVYKRVICKIASGRFNSDFSVSESEDLILTKSGGYVKFELSGYLYYSSGGMVFGILPLPEIIANGSATL